MSTSLKSTNNSAGTTAINNRSLTPRQAQIARLAACSLSDKEILLTLGITAETVAARSSRHFRC